MNCERPGCTGQVVDGYCDECGMAPARRPDVGAPEATGTRALGGGSASAAGPSMPTRAAAPSNPCPLSTKRTPTSGRSVLGAGFVPIPEAPYRDPAEAVLADPSVPERRRFCARCDEPVGRTRDGSPGRTSGFCRKCGTPFSFEPKLRPGELVSGRYEVAGCLAHGGMGWVYLAKDRNLENRAVVLKGLLNTGDADAVAAAVAERQFLIEVEHPNIVKILDSLEHDGAGYIVMEYVGGQSLKQILAAPREANGDEADPLPAAQAIAYMVDILPALEHLHEIGLLFCDFKPDNVMQTRHSLKLIDLGGVYRISRPSAVMFGTIGYQAPEIASAGPSVSSDLFTVARTLAALCIDFKGYQGTYRYTLPPQESVPLFQRYDSLYRILMKGTADDPRDRFQSAEEMREQLLGVLREIVASEEGKAVPAPSTLFTAPLRARLERADWRVLPRPQANADDESAGYLAAITATDPAQMIVQLNAAPVRTVEVDLRLVTAMIEGGDLDGAEALMAQIEARPASEWDPTDWRVRWFRGIDDLARGLPTAARRSFAAVYAAVPGELAPKLALGVACEAEGDPGEAARWYEIVARTDTSITSAAFGLARSRLQLGDRVGAIAAYQRVPDSTSGYLDAQTARIRCLSTGNGSGTPSLDDLLAAGSILQDLPVDDAQRQRLTVHVLEAALPLTLAGTAFDDGHTRLLGHRLAERDIRLGLERYYRALARQAGTRAELIRLVDQANRTRPRTWT